MTLDAVDVRPGRPLESRPTRRAGWLVLLPLILVFSIGIWAAWSFTVDDAYITFRYSRHLAEGRGPVWNVGEDPVEGFTNFAWMVWHAFFIWVGLSPVIVAKLTSIAVGSVIIAMLLRDGGDRRGGLVAAATFVLFVPTYFHITGGLETVAFAAVLLRAVILGLRVLQGQPLRDWEPPVLLLVAGMLRPEGVLAALPAVLVWLGGMRGRRLAWQWTGGVCLVGIVYFAWRWTYFGHVFPNTFYVKFGNVAAGGQWLTMTAVVFAPLLLSTLALLVSRTRRREGLLLIATVAATYLTYAVSGPSMDYLHRFAFHAFPVLCLGAGLAVRSVGARWLGRTVGAVAVAWVAVSGLKAPDLPLVANYGNDLQRAHVAIGRGLARAPVPQEARTIALSDAGAIPYYSGWETIDYIGLNHEAVAHGADVSTVVADARPTVIVVTSPSDRPQRYGYGLGTQVTNGYALITSVRMRRGYWQVVYALPEHAQDIKRHLARTVDRAQGAHDAQRYDVTLGRWFDRLRSQLPAV